MTALEHYAEDLYQKKITDCTNEELFNILATYVVDKTQVKPTHRSKKKLYYFSAEFLVGRLLSDNLINLGLYHSVRDELFANGKDLDEIVSIEIEPSLGNGGLGRLAACFMDALAKLELNADGVGLNYHFGLFKQTFVRNEQVGIPDEWLNEEKWLTEEDKRYKVRFRDFSLVSSLRSIDVNGHKAGYRNRIRLFDLDTVDPSIIEDGSINFDPSEIKKNLTLFLYPDDSTAEGRQLRLYQEYFMVSNGVQLVIDEALDKGSNLHDLADYAVIQINDTHPSLVIPEMIRVLEERGLSRDEAIEITRSMVAYTNHTVLAEALEVWPVDVMEAIIPNILEIIRDLDARVRAQFPNQEDVFIIRDNKVNMASMSVHYGFSINGVAELHTEILKHSQLPGFYKIYPEKFNNKTNGISFRRWIMGSNSYLADELDKLLGEEWRNTHDLSGLIDYLDDNATIQALRAIKHRNKLRLQKHLLKHQGVVINENSIIDVQIKRIHEYKRQQMNVLYIIYKYLQIKSGFRPKTPITFIFGGKAAPAYVLAQDIIHTILTLSKVISEDEDVSPYLKVVMVDNYNVTEAEHLIPAADISEQISLASREASGTSNMKFMLNGALTISTLDGSNIELANLVGKDNIYLFGKKSEEILDLYRTNGYHSYDYYMHEKIKPLVDFLVSPGMLFFGNPERLYRLHDDIIKKDYFMALIDLEEYIDVRDRVYNDYENQKAWMNKVIANIAEAGYFSADRTIKEYNRDIWHLETED